MYSREYTKIVILAISRFVIYKSLLQATYLSFLQHPVVLKFIHSTSNTPTPGTPSRQGKSHRAASNGPLHVESSESMLTGVSDKPKSSFFSSLSIAVNGAVPIESDISQDSVILLSLMLPNIW
jgi:hypothetical protein